LEKEHFIIQDARIGVMYTIIGKNIEPNNHTKYYLLEPLTVANFNRQLTLFLFSSSTRPIFSPPKKGRQNQIPELRGSAQLLPQYLIKSSKNLFTHQLFSHHKKII